ncbi:unnamed protein product [Parajaminaea phylloscopi]
MSAVASASKAGGFDPSSSTSSRMTGNHHQPRSSSSGSGVGGAAAAATTTTTTTGPPLRKFAEISIEELPEVLAVAKDSLNPIPDLETWMSILEAVSEQGKARRKQRDEWNEQLAALSSQLSSLRAAQPRSSWRTPAAHSQQLATHGQKTLELAKQISKLEMVILRTETDVRECKTELDRLDKGDAAPDSLSTPVEQDGGEDDDDDDEEPGMGERALGRHTLALTMFRQLGFQPLLPQGAGSDASISTLFARSDSKGKVTPFKVGDEPSSGGVATGGQAGWTKMSDAERVKLANAMWDAVE